MEGALKLNLPSFLLSFFLLFLLTGASHHHHHHRHRGSVRGSRPTKLFVFGDSYADTGNNNVSSGASWHVPYGVTFPGEPAGRFSNGRVLTDYVAKFVGLKSPIAYRRWKSDSDHRSVGDQSHLVQSGINFAYGGSGVFKTLSSYPNMTSQIGFFNHLINSSLFTHTDIHSSVALVTLAGNDYAAYLQLNGSAQGLVPFITSVVAQFKVNLKAISGLGVKKIGVGGLQPLGCSPPFTASTSYQKCNDTLNALVGVHNTLLQQAVASLNNETNTTFFILDLYTSFASFLINTTSSGESKFKSPLKQCCAGTSALYTCGGVDANGVKQYTVCENPESAFFWDNFHPTQAGWSAVYPTIQTALQQFLH